MSPDELRLTPLRPIHALTLGAWDYSTHDVDEASRPMRYAKIRHWVITACMRPQTTAFLVRHAEIVVGACSLTSNEHRAQTVEIQLACPEASLHADVVSGMFAQLEVIANAQRSRLLSIWVSPKSVQFRAAAASGFVESAAETLQLQTLGGCVEAVEWTKFLHRESDRVAMECNLEAAAC